MRVNGVAPGAIATDLRGPRALDMADRSIGDVLKPEMMKGGLPIELQSLLLSQITMLVSKQVLGDLR